MTTTQITIIAGPSKFDLMNALFVWQPIRHKVEFKVQDGCVYTANINACEAEDGSGESWNIRGSATNTGGRLKIVKRFTGYFRTDTRRGHLMITD